jgi:rubrerythrin
MIQEAVAAGRDDLASSFTRARDVEERHADLYKEALNALASDLLVNYHVCQVCGYVFSAELPDFCPVCQAGKNQFKAI